MAGVGPPRAPRRRLIRGVDDSLRRLNTDWIDIHQIQTYEDSRREITRTHGKGPAQVMLRWGLQHGRWVIPKSTKPSRIEENINVFDYQARGERDVLDRRPGHRPSRRPRTGRITLEAFGREIPEAEEPSPFDQRR